MMNKFYGDWESLADIAKDFREDISFFNGMNILFAAYTYEDYSGSAFVLYEYEGNLYEVNANHCSCYGLEEDGWSPEDTSKEAIEHRLNNGEGYGIFRAHKKEILEALEGYQTEKITWTGQSLLQQFVDDGLLDENSDTDGPKFVDSDTVIEECIQEIADLKKRIEQNSYNIERNNEKLKTAEELIDSLQKQNLKYTEIVRTIGNLVFYAKDGETDK